MYNDGQGCAQTDGINCANATSPRTVIHTDFNGDTITTAYDVMGRTIAVQYSKDGNSDVFTYTANGHVHTVTDQHGTTTYTYDSNNRLLTEIKTDGTQMRYEYDAVGNRTLVEITRGGSITSSTTYTYDDLNRLENVIDSSGTTTYTYDAVGNLDTVAYPNGLVTDYDYNAVNQLTDVVTRDAINTIINHFNYSLTLTGRREIITELDGRTTAYCYDDLYRLTDEVVFETTPAIPPSTGCITDTAGADYVANYEYDWVGNREYETVDGVQTAYAYDLNDRLTSTGGTVYTYDDNGNTITETLDGVVKTYTWDGKNKLINFDNAGSVTNYTYNHNGIRNGKTELGVTTQFIVDENRDYAQVLEEVESGSTTVAYTYGHDLLSQERGVDTSWYHYDGLGSTRALSDGLGTFTDEYNYFAFGELSDQSGSSENNYLFTGEQRDGESGNYYLRARYMSPNNGNFLSMDTYQGRIGEPATLHKYVYTHSDPVNNIDPSGNTTATLSGLSVSLNIQGILNTAAIGGALYLSGMGDDTVATQTSFVNDLQATVVYSQVKSDINYKANELSHDVERALAASSSDGTWQAHHTVPIYMCGAVEQSPNMVPLKSTFHRALHSSLRLYAEFVDEVYGAGFDATRSLFDHTSSTNRGGLRQLARTRVGRSFIANHLESFYSTGWYAGNANFKSRFEAEKSLFINTTTRNSLPGCQR